MHFRIRNLQIWQKFAIIGVLALMASVPPSVQLILAKVEQLRITGTERDAMQAVERLSTLIRLTQQHRGLTAGWLGGNASVKPAREAKSGEVSNAFRAAIESTAAFDDAGDSGAAGALQRDWQSLARDLEGTGLVAADSFKRHTALITGQIQLLSRVADRSALILEAEPALYHLIAASVESLPMIAEMLARSRGMGANILGRQAATLQERATLSAAVGIVEQHTWATNRHLDAARDASAVLGSRLAPQRQAAAGAVDQALRLVREKIIEPEQPSEPVGTFFDAMTGPIDAQFKLTDAMVSELRAAFDARLGADRFALFGTIALFVLAVSGVALAIAWIARSTSRDVGAAVKATEALARGDLTHRVDTDAGDEIGRITRGVGEAIDSLAAIVAEIRSASEAVGTASTEIASGNMDLSARTEAAAASLQQAAASMEQLATTLRNSAQSAHQATELATNASEVAGEGAQLIGQVVATMNDINASSRRVSDIIGVIDGIAFQTNILALNAAVEAARAGEQGRGFAVVAGEVRALAQRSAQAAREIKTLIASSTTTVDAGTRLVDQSGRTIGAIVEQAAKVRELIGSVERSADEESSGIAQINTAVAHLDHSTQQNAALVEESAAAASSLKSQAQRLVDLIGRFRLAA